MKSIVTICVVVSTLMWSVVVSAQPREANVPTEAIGRVCRTMEQHPPPTAEANYNLLDYAICGPGGLRVFPAPQIAQEFDKIKKGEQGGKPGKDIVYFKGLTKTVVMPAFGTKGTPTWRPRFRFSWLDATEMKGGVSISSRPQVKVEDGTAHVSVELKNPLNKAISGTKVVLTLRGAQFTQPFTKSVPTLGPGERRTVTFDVPVAGKPKGRVHIQNYGRVYVDVVETF